MLPNKSRGLRVDDRLLNGTFWLLRSGAPWCDRLCFAPERANLPALAADFEKGTALLKPEPIRKVENVGCQSRSLNQLPLRQSSPRLPGPLKRGRESLNFRVHLKAGTTTGEH